MSLPDSILARLTALGTSPQDVEERFVRGSGPGGQKINKTSSTVWLRHQSTGTEVRCQAERSQAANRERAWDELCSRLEEGRRAASAAQIDAKELHRRRNRQKSFGQKMHMVQTKRRRARHKASRVRVGDE